MARFTLNDLDIERHEDPFEIELPDAEPFRLVDPKALHANKLLRFDPANPVAMLTAVVADGRGRELLEHPAMDGYALDAICRRYVAHYGLGDVGKGSA